MKITIEFSAGATGQRPFEWNSSSSESLSNDCTVRALGRDIREETAAIAKRAVLDG
ncbi:MAG: hypothetical protein AAF989_06150 [Planctomycetota bacterium]